MMRGSSVSGAWRRVADWVGPLAGLLAMGAVLSFASPYFLTRSNLTNIAVQASPIAILAVGETAVIIAGGIDLSVGSVLALCAVAAAVLTRNGMSITTACLAALVCGSACSPHTGGCRLLSPHSA